MSAPATGSLTIRRYPDPVLRALAQPVTTFDAGLAQLVDRMFVTMREDGGVGLAAPQVGVSQRLFVTDHHAGREDLPPAPRVWINPRFENCEGTVLNEEGCLSLPGLYANVERAARFDVVYQDLDGGEQRLHLDYEAGEFLAIVVQHENDHLEGRLFVDHLSHGQLAMLRRKLKELEKAFKKRTGTRGAVLRR